MKIKLLALLTLFSVTSVNAENLKDTYVSVKFEGVAETVPPDDVDWKTRSLKGSTGNVTVYVGTNDVPTEVYVIGVAAIPTTMNAVRAE